MVEVKSLKEYFEGLAKDSLATEEEKERSRVLFGDPEPRPWEDVHHDLLDTSSNEVEMPDGVGENDLADDGEQGPKRPLEEDESSELREKRPRVARNY